MLRATILFAVGLCANLLIGLPVMAQAPADVTLTRIDCGTGATPTDVGQRFSDTFAYKDLKLTFTFSCYLIKHGNDYIVWDTGFAPGTNPNAPKVGIVDRLKEVKVTPEQVKYVGTSHFHGDHTGQLAVHERDAAHRQGRLGRDHRDAADAGRQRRRLQELDR